MGEAPEAGRMVTPNLRLVRALGEGGMGSVWVAFHLSLRTEVVVKFMAEDLAKNEEAVARFGREAAAAAQVKSPHVVQTLDHGFADGGRPYIVMELLEGHDLAVHLDQQRGPLPLVEVAAIVTQLARALTKAHAMGIVHRDIKPSNVFLCDSGAGELFVKLLDFGIAKAQALKATDDTTRTGSFVGSPFYMSPEQVVGAKGIDWRSDLWSLGVVAFEMLTGKRPFDADTVGGLALKIHRDPLPVPTEHDPRLPSAVDPWFARACARDPGERFQSAKEMAAELSSALTGERATPEVSSDAPARARQISALAETAPAPVTGAVSTLPSGKRADATDAGVGLASRSAPSYLPSRKRGKVVVAVMIAITAVGVGFMVPRMLGVGAPSAGASGTASASTARVSTMQLADTSAPSSTSPSARSSSAAPAFSVPPAMPAPVSNAGGGAVHVAAPAASHPSGGAASAKVKPPPSPSDDDIK